MEKTENNSLDMDIQSEVPQPELEQNLISPQPQTKKNKFLVLILLGIMGFILVGIGGYYLGLMNSNIENRVTDSIQVNPENKIADSSQIIPKDNIEKEEMVACTMEAKACPDGSFVSRVAPDCEFEACPIEVDTEELHISLVNSEDLNYDPYFVNDMANIRIGEKEKFIVLIDPVVKNNESLENFRKYLKLRSTDIKIPWEGGGKVYPSYDDMQITFSDYSQGKLSGQLTTTISQVWYEKNDPNDPDCKSDDIIGWCHIPQSVNIKLIIDFEAQLL